ncbi:hypothetical protein NDU88_005091 [Pleurodeles waltl]|uniref:Secreted protein n=1 Tax=Pleurodeles waltl TaxID=8319 RepID=A0AAV7NLI6_PLEWA|nr:hypothetical protein NDU88_005091 [Pleurodeles waltl]
MAAVLVVGVATEVFATTRELPSEEASLSELSPPVSAVVRPLPSVPLVPSLLVDLDSWALWDAAPSVASASAPPPDDGNVQKDRVPFLQEDEAGDGCVAAVDPVDSEDEEAENEDEDNRRAIIRQYFQ